MERLVLTLPPALSEELRHRAAELGKPPEQLAEEMLAAALGDDRSEQQTTRKILEAAGEVRPLGSSLRQSIVRDVPLEEVRSTLSSAEGPGLSDLLLEQRGSTA